MLLMRHFVTKINSISKLKILKEAKTHVFVLQVSQLLNIHNFDKFLDEVFLLQKHGWHVKTHQNIRMILLQE